MGLDDVLAPPPPTTTTTLVLNFDFSFILRNILSYSFCFIFEIKTSKFLRKCKVLKCHLGYNDAIYICIKIIWLMTENIITIRIIFRLL